MFIDLKEISREGFDFDREVTLADLEVEGSDPVRVRDTRCRGTIVPDERGVSLRGRIETSLTLGCSRCLESVVQTLRFEFGLTLVGDGTEFGGNDARVQEEDVDLYYATDGRAHLGEIVREQIYLQLPLKPVCRDDCRGLCPTCGSDRNRIECLCTNEDIDPRLLPLLELKQDRTGES